MKKLFSILSVILPLMVNSQDTPDFEGIFDETVYGNAYRYHKAYKENRPFLATTFVFEKITGDQFYNAYDILSAKAKVKKKDLRYGIWLVDTDSIFYINIMRYGYIDIFIKFKKFGNYYYFFAQPQTPDYRHEVTTEIASAYGIAGVVVGTIIDGFPEPRYWHAVLDFENDVAYYLTKEYLEYLLTNYPDLNKEFSKESDKENIEVLKLYLTKINKKYESINPKKRMNPEFIGL